MKRLVLLLVALFLALLVVPMILARFTSAPHRSFEWVGLEEVEFREIRFRNHEQNLELAGMLFVPPGSGPFPAAVIIHGSGTSRRGNGWYLTLSRYLQRSGVVVLLPDKRGSEESQGNWHTASLEDLATDTIAAVAYLTAQQEVAISGVGIVGLSQGGQIAPLVASRTPVSFVVSIVGGAVPMHEALVYEETYNLRELGVLPGLAHVLAYPAAWSLIEVRQREFWDAVGNFDSAVYWRQVDVPALALFGEQDTNVPSARSAAAIRALHNPYIEVEIYPGSGHALESPTGDGNSILRLDALADIAAFIRSSISPAVDAGAS